MARRYAPIHVDRLPYPDECLLCALQSMIDVPLEQYFEDLIRESRRAQVTYGLN